MNLDDGTWEASEPIQMPVSSLSILKAKNKGAFAFMTAPLASISDHRALP